MVNFKKINLRLCLLLSMVILLASFKFIVPDVVTDEMFYSRSFNYTIYRSAEHAKPVHYTYITREE